MTVWLSVQSSMQKCNSSQKVDWNKCQKFLKKKEEKVAMTKFVIMCLICFISHGIESADS